MYKYLLSLLFLFSLGIVASAQYTDLHDFNDTLGAGPYGSLTFAGQKLYGMTSTGGLSGLGCVFSLDTNGKAYKVIHNFNGTGGWSPQGSLLFSGNKLYGMTQFGGSADSGCVFSLDTDGSGYKVILNFSGTNGRMPQGSLILSGKVLYGMTLFGGVARWGNIFSIDTDGANYKDLLDFKGKNGSLPNGSLILSGKTLYGMTISGGALHDSGCVFSIDTNGTAYKDLHDFNGINGCKPYGSLLQEGNKLYGMTSWGGISNQGNIFSIDTNGNGFKEMYDFPLYAGSSSSSLILIGSELYGLANDYIFSIDTSGNIFTNHYNFPVNVVGFSGSLICSGNTLYGMSNGLRDHTLGNIYSFNLLGSGIDNLTADKGLISAYPNPSNGVFTIEMKNEKLKAKNVEIYNVMGEKVTFGMLKQVQHDWVVDLSGQPNGVYFYRVLEVDGGVIGEGKLIIQK